MNLTPQNKSLRRAIGLCATAIALVGAYGGKAAAYVPDDRWSTTASGSGGTTGDPITLTWSLARNGTSIPDEGASNLISYLDGLLGAGPGGTDFTQRPWFHLFKESFDRWSQLGGINFVYEPNDSTATALSSLAGSLGARGDIRIGGANIDGPSGTLAYTYLPNDGDMVVDTGETTFYADSSNNYRALRNTLMYEIGHAFGLLHVNSSNSSLLMEPYIDVSFDGPQLDEIRGIQGMYGDAYEKTFSGLGNDAAARATNLGSLSAGSALAIGTAARGSQAVGPTETDFVSIANAADADYFSFTLASPATVDFSLTPLGGVFSQGAETGGQSTFDANARNNLALTVFGPNGSTQLAFADNTLAGQAESIFDLDFSTAGQYYVRVTGATTSVQLYELALSAAALVVQPSSGDFNGDGAINGADFLLWQRTLGSTGAGLAADGNHDNVVNAADLALWREQFGSPPSVVTSARAVPEPSATAMLIAAMATLTCERDRRSINGRDKRL